MGTLRAGARGLQGVFSSQSHSSCLGAGSFQDMSQLRLFLRRHLLPLLPHRKPAGQQ